MNTLALFEAIAKKIKPYQKVNYFLAVVFMLFIVMALIFPIQAELISLDVASGYGKLALLGCIWLLLLNIMVSIFIDAPEVITEEHSFFTRYRLKIKRLLYYILAMLFIILTLTILVLSVRLLRA